MKRIGLICIFVLLLSSFAGCGSHSPQQKSASTVRPEVTISGTSFTVGGTTFDIQKLDGNVNAILQCSYVTDYDFIVEGHINPHISFYALFNIEAKDYSCSILRLRII